MVSVFPNRNLPLEAEDWGRQVENLIIRGERDNTQLDQKIDNGLRSISGQLAVNSNQVSELARRNIEIVQVEELTVPSSGTVSETVSFPSFEGSELALFTLGFSASSSNPQTDSNPLVGPAFTITVQYRGEPILQLMSDGFIDRSRQPADFRNFETVSARQVVEIPGGSSPSFTVVFESVGSTASFSVSNFTASLSRTGLS